MEYLDEADVRCIRTRLASTEMAGRDFGGDRPLNENNFSSAVARQHAGYGGQLKFKTIPEVAATLFYGLNLNHAFENGNKRTALVSLLAFLQRNKLVLADVSEDELYDLSLQVASHTIPLAAGVERTPDSEVQAIATWLRVNSRPLALGDKRMQFREFRTQLEALGCEFDKPDNNYIKVRRSTGGGVYTAKMGYPKADFNVGVRDVKRVRQQLKLDEIHGVDSAAFYELESAVDGFVNKYRNLLDRLAET